MPVDAELFLREVDTNCLIKFISSFTRLEYALKEAGYYRSKKNGDVIVCWDCFYNKIHKQLEEARKDKKLNDAINYFENTDTRPKKQVVNDAGFLDWKDADGNLLVLIRRVRNNFFHGGKYKRPNSDDTIYIQEPTRDAKLLENAEYILQEALKLDGRVESAYENYRL